MSFSASYTADSTFSSMYLPTDNTPSFVQIVGTTLNITDPRTITNSNDLGVTGEICWDNDYVYVCVDTDTWKRTALSTW